MTSLLLAASINRPEFDDPGSDGSLQAAFPCFAATAAAALRITSSTARGWDSIGTWLLFTSTVVAPMRFAAKRSSSGLTVRSSVATIDQLGFDRQATPSSCFWVKR